MALKVDELVREYGLTPEKAQALIDKQRADAIGACTVLISDKTFTVCVSGVRRFKIAFYPGEWDKLAALMPRILEVCKLQESGNAPKELYFTPKPREE